MGMIFSKRPWRRRQCASHDNGNDKHFNVDVSASRDFHNVVARGHDTQCLEEHLGYWNHSLYHDHDIWESTDSKQWWRHFVLDMPEHTVGGSLSLSVGLLCLYVLWFRRVWVRRSSSNNNNNSRKKSSAVIREIVTRSSSGISELHDEDSVNSSSRGDDADPSHSLQEKSIPILSTHTAPDPNTFTTPERSKASLVTPLAVRGTMGEQPLLPLRLHPQSPQATLPSSQLPQTGLPTSQLPPRPESNSNLLALSSTTDNLTLQLQQRQAQWDSFQASVKSKEQESLKEIQTLKTQIQSQETKLQQHLVSKANEYQQMASKVESMQQSLEQQKHKLLAGTTSHGIASTTTPPSSSVLDLKQRLQQLEDELRHFQVHAQAKNVEYATQIQSLQTEILHSSGSTLEEDNGNTDANGDANKEEGNDDDPETNRPPPSHSPNNSAFRPVVGGATATVAALPRFPNNQEEKVDASTHSDDMDAAAEDRKQDYLGILSQIGSLRSNLQGEIKVVSPSSLSSSQQQQASASQSGGMDSSTPTPVVFNTNKARRSAEYGDLVQQVQLLTHSIQRGPSEQQQQSASSQEALSIDTTTATTLKPDATTDTTSSAKAVSAPPPTSKHNSQHYLQVLQERSADCAQLEAQVKRLQWQLEFQVTQHQQALNQSKRDAAQWQSQMEAMQATAELQEQRIARQQRQLATLATEKQTALDLVAVREQMLSQQGSADSDKDSEHQRSLEAQYQETVSQLQATLAIHQSACEELSAKNEALTKELQATCQRASVKELKLNGELQAAHDLLSAAQQEHRQELDSQQRECTTLAARVGSLETQLAASQAEVTAVQQNAAEKEQALVQQMESLKVELQVTQTKSKSQLRQLEELQEEHEELVTVETHQEVSQALRHCEDCSKDMEKSFEAKATEMRLQISTLQSQLKDSTTFQEQLQREMKLLQNDSDALQNELQRVQTALQAKDRAHQGEMQFLQAKLDDNVHRLQLATKEKERICSELKSKMKELTGSLAECQDELDQYQDEAMAKEVVLKAQVGSLQMELEVATQQRNKAAAKNELLSEQVTTLQIKTENQESNIQHMAKERKDLEKLYQKQVIDLSQDLDRKNQRVVELEAALESRDDEIVHWKAEATERADAEKREQELMAQVSCLQRDLKARESDIVKKDQELAAVASDFESLQVEKTELSEVINCFKHLFQDKLKDPAVSPGNLGSSQHILEIQALFLKFQLCLEQLGAAKSDNSELVEEMKERDVTHQKQLQDFQDQCTKLQAALSGKSKELQQQEDSFAAYKHKSDLMEKQYADQIQLLKDQLETRSVLFFQRKQQLSESESDSDDERGTMVEALTLQLGTYDDKLLKLEERLAAKTSECNTLSSKLADSYAETRSMSTLEKQLQQAEKTIKESGKLRESLEQELREARTSAAALELQIRDIETQSQSRALAADETVDLGDKAAMISEELAEAKKEIVARDDEMSQLRQQAMHATQAKDEAESRLLTAKADLETLEMKLNDALSLAKRSEAHAQASLSELEKTQQDLGDKSIALEETIRKEAGLASKLSEKEKACAALDDRVARLLEQLLSSRSRASEADARVEATEAECTELQSKILDLQAAIKEIEERNEKSTREGQNELDQVKGKAASLERELQRRRFETQQSKDAEDSLVKTVRKLEASRNELVASLDAKELAIVSAIEENQSLRMQVKNLKATEQQLTEANARILNLEATVDGLREMEAMLEGERASGRAIDQQLKTCNSNMESLEKALTQKEDVVEQLFVEKKALAQELEEAKSFEFKLRTASDRISLQDNSLSASESELARARSQIEKDSEEKSQLRLSLRDLESKLSSIQKALSQKESMLQVAMEEKKTLAEEVKVLNVSKTKLEEAASKIAKLELSLEKMPQLQSEASHLASQSKQSNEKLLKTERRLQEANEKSMKLKSRLEEKENLLVMALGEKSSLGKDVEGLKAELSLAKAEITTLESNLEESRLKLSSNEEALRSQEAEMQELEEGKVSSEKTLRSLADRVMKLLEQVKQKEEVIQIALKEKRDLESGLREAEAFEEEKLASAKAKLDALELDLQREQQERKRLEEDNISLGQNLRRAEVSAGELKLKVEKLEGDSESHVVEKREVAQELIELKIAYAASENDLKIAKSSLEELKTRESLVITDLGKKEKKLVELEAQLAEVVKTASLYKQSVAEAEEKLIGYERICFELDEVKSSLEKMEVAKNVALTAKENIENSLVEQKAQCEHLQAQVLTLKEGLNSSKQENQLVTQSLAEARASEKFTEDKLDKAHEMQKLLEAEFESKHLQLVRESELNKSLQADLKTANEAIDSLESQVNELTVRNTRQQEELKKMGLLSKELEALKLQHATKAKEVTETSQKFSDYKEELQKIQHSNAELKEKLAAAESSVNSCNAKISMMEGTGRAQLAEKKGLLQNVSILNKTVANLQKDLDGYKEKLEATKQREMKQKDLLEKVEQSKKQEMEDKIKLEAELQVARSICGDQEKKISELEATGHDYHSTQESLVAERDSLVKELEKARATSASKVEALAEELRTLKTANAQLRALVDEASEQKEVYKSNERGLRDELEASIVSIKKEANTRQKAETELQKIQTACESLSLKVSKLEDENAAQMYKEQALLNELSALKKKNADHKDGLEAASQQQAEKEALASEVALLQATIARHETQLKEANLQITVDKAVSDEKQKLVGDMSELKENLKSLADENEDQAEKIAILKEKIEQQETELKEANLQVLLGQAVLNEKQVLSQEVSKIKEANKSLFDEKQVIAKELEEVKEAALQQKDKLLQTIQDLESYKQRQALSETNLSEKNKKVSDLQNKVAGLERLLAASQKSCDDLKRSNNVENIDQLKLSAQKINETEQTLKSIKQEEQYSLEAQAGCDVARVTELEQNIEQLRAELVASEKEKKQVLDDKDSLSKDLDEVRTKVQQLEHQLVDLEQASQSYLDALGAQMTLTNELEELKVSKEQVDIRLQEATEKIGILESELDETNSELEKCAQDADAQEKRVMEAEALLEVSKKEHKETLDEIERHFRDLSNKVKVVTQKLQEKESQLEQLEEKASRSGSEHLERINSLEVQLREKETICERLKNVGELKVRTGRSRAVETNFEDIAREMEEKTNECEQLRDSLNALKQDLEGSQQRAQVLQSELDNVATMSVENNELGQQIKAKTESCAILTGKVDELETAVQVKDSKISALEDKVKDAEEMACKMETLTQELVEQQNLQEKVNASMAELMSLVEEKSTQCAQLEATIATMKKEFKGVSNLRSKVETLETEIKTQEEQKEKLNQSLNDLKNKHDEKEKACSKLMAELNNLRDQVVVMESEGSSKDGAESDEVRQLKNELEEQRGQCERLRSLNQDMNKTMAEADKMCTDLTLKLDSLNGECRNYADTVARLQEELDSKRGVSSADTEKLQAELNILKEDCDRLNVANKNLENVLREKDEMYNELVEKTKTLEKDCKSRAERIAELENKLASRYGSNAADEEIARLKEELNEQHAHQDGLNKKMIEMLGLWEEKEQQCATFKLKLDELTERLENRDAQIIKLKEEVAGHEENATRMDSMVQELQQQQTTQEKTNESMQKMLTVLEEKEKEVSQLATKIKEMTLDHKNQEKEWEIRLSRSESELFVVREERMADSLQTDDKDNTEHSQLSSRLETLTSKITEGEKQLADLEREFKEKWESASLADSVSQTSKTTNSGKKKKKVKMPKLLSRFRR